MKNLHLSEKLYSMCCIVVDITIIIGQINVTVFIEEAPRVK